MRITKRAALLAAATGTVSAALGLATVLLIRDESGPQPGDLIAYSCDEPGNDWFAVCIVRMDGTSVRRLTERLPTSDPVWSSDGRRIAFTRHQDVGEYTTFQDDDIFVMDGDGDGPQQLTENPAGRSSGLAEWSTDGRSIAFVRGSSVSTGGTILGSIYVMDADGTGLRRLTRGPWDTDPAWSPDGRKLAFTRTTSFRSSSNADVYVVSTSGGKPQRLTWTARALESEPAWSATDTKIAFARTTPTAASDGGAAIYVMNRDGSGVRRVVHHRHFTRFPGNLAWGPDGRTLAFETSPADDCRAIHLVDVGSGRVRPLTSCARGSRSALSPSWQPAGD